MESDEPISDPADLRRVAQPWICAYRLTFSDGGEDEFGMLYVGTEHGCLRAMELLAAVNYEGDRPDPQCFLWADEISGEALEDLWVCDRCGQLLDEDERCNSAIHQGPDEGNDAETRGRPVRWRDVREALA
jgi:hypothetical protein